MPASSWHAVVQVVADAPLFAVADLQNLAFQPFALGDVARDALDLHQLTALFDQPGADFQLHALARRRGKIVFDGRPLDALDDAAQPFARRRLLFRHHKINEVPVEDFLTGTLEQFLAGFCC